MIMQSVGKYVYGAVVWACAQKGTQDEEDQEMTD
jgi:hypothetical protein